MDVRWRANAEDYMRLDKVELMAFYYCAQSRLSAGGKIASVIVVKAERRRHLICKLRMNRNGSVFRCRRIHRIFLNILFFHQNTLIFRTNVYIPPPSIYSPSDKTNQIQATTIQPLDLPILQSHLKKICKIKHRAPHRKRTYIYSLSRAEQ